MLVKEATGWMSAIQLWLLEHLRTVLNNIGRLYWLWFIIPVLLLLLDLQVLHCNHFIGIFYHTSWVTVWFNGATAINSSWPHAFARIMARERRAAHGPNSRDCWSPGEPARVQPPFPQDIWTLSCSVIRLALIGAGVLARIWSISNN